MNLPLPRSAWRLSLRALFIFCWTAGSATAQAPLPFFGPVLSIGNTQSGVAYPGQVAADAQGNVYASGTFGGTVYFGNQALSSRLSQLDVFVVKYDALGHVLWVASAGGDGPDYGSGLAVDARGNVYVTGRYGPAAAFGALTLPAAAGRNDAFVAKLSPAGQWLWATHGGGTDDDGGTAVAVDAAGTVTVLGLFRSATVTLGTTQLTNSAPAAFPVATFLGRLTADGSWLSAVAVGQPGNVSGAGLALDAAGNAYVSGSFAGASAGFGGVTLANAAPGTYDAFVAKLTPAGSWQWAARAGGPGHDHARGLAADATGRVYVTGGFSGPAAFGATTLATQGPGSGLDVFVAALAADGTWRWATPAGGSGSKASSGLALDAAGGVVVTGEFFSPNLRFGATTLATTGPNSDAFVAKLDAQGGWQWALGSSGDEEEIGYALAPAADGSTYLLGSYRGRAVLGSTTLPGTQPFEKVFLAQVYEAEPLALTALAPSSGAPGQTVTVAGRGFVGVTAVLFNGAPAAAFAVQSATQLTAVVPAGVTPGPVSVRTGAGAGSSPVPFQPTALAAASPSVAGLALYPNPASAWVHLPGLPVGTGVQLLDAWGREVRATVLTAAARVSVRGLAPGFYLLRAKSAQGLWFAGRVAVE